MFSVVLPHNRQKRLPPFRIIRNFFFFFKDKAQINIATHAHNLSIASRFIYDMWTWREVPLHIHACMYVCMYLMYVCIADVMAGLYVYLEPINSSKKQNLQNVSVCMKRGDDDKLYKSGK